MGDVVNLKRVRKAIARAQDAKTADANRAKYGQTKAEKQLRKLELDRESKVLDAHKIET